MSNSWKEHQVLIHFGKYNTHKNTNQPYETKSLGDIFLMPPGAQPKSNAVAMVPSSYSASDGRTHEVQQSNGNYVAICGDVDVGNKDLNEVVEMVTEFAGPDVAWLVYSSSSSSAENRKWRIVFPIDTPIRFSHWHEASEVFYDFAEARGFTMDRSLSRAGQPVFLPNVPPERRGGDGVPFFYETRSAGQGRGLRFSDPHLRQVEGIVKRKEWDSVVLASRRAAKRPTPAPIRQFNNEHDIEDLFTQYGYTPASNARSEWRSPYQTSNSFATRVFSDENDQYWVSLSQSDAAAGLGRESANGARFGDAFDLHAHFDLGCDRNAALAKLKSELEPDALEQIQAAISAVEAGDAGAAFEPEVLAALRELRASDQAEWMRVRAKLKAANVGIVELDKATKDESEGTDDPKQADLLIALARERCTFIHDEQDEPYAVFEVAGARQVHHVQLQAFSDFLSHAFYRQFDRAPTEQALKTALSTLRGAAKFEGETCKVSTRIAKTGSGYWLDLCNEQWQCVWVTPIGWTVVSGNDAPLFTRTASMRALPHPDAAGNIEDLWPLINVPEDDRLLVLTWLLECLREDTPHVVLELVGEQGSAKSSTQKTLRQLIDPNQADLRAAPKSVEDLWISARNSHLVSLENVSNLQATYQDALCVLATGGGHSTRKLYTNTEESILELRKPIVLNGIASNVTAQDLVDRSVRVDLPTIKARELHSEHMARVEATLPALLGGLLNLFAKVLATLPSVSVNAAELPRMADFAKLGEAVARVHGHSPGTFLRIYNSKRRDSVLATIDAFPVGAALLALLETKTSGYKGTLGDLLKLLEIHTSTREGFPKTPKRLGDMLRRLAPALRVFGYECEPLPKTGGKIQWNIFPKSLQAELSPACPESPATRSGHTGHAGYSPSWAEVLKNLPQASASASKQEDINGKAA